MSHPHHTLMGAYKVPTPFFKNQSNFPMGGVLSIGGESAAVSADMGAIHLKDIFSTHKVPRMSVSSIKYLASVYSYVEAFAKVTGDGTMAGQQHALLLALFVHGELNQMDLPQYTGVERSSNSRNIARLGEGVKPYIEKGPGWVEAYEDPLDRRIKKVRLTPKGRAMLETVAKEATSRVGST